mmetsp:Transcript_47832/g.150027  ORF Transcript_47832/g.150027 Transcript_47832/m.150027 type:complete len:125 (-) Transcript_47832:132-506(-)
MQNSERGKICYLTCIRQAAKAEWEKLTKNDGCGSEACKGYICANLFPRCFYLNESAQGSFLFETCRETCNDCLSSCAKDRSTECLVNPSQYESACTSIANVNRQDVGVVLITVLSFFCIWFATV